MLLRIALTISIFLLCQQVQAQDEFRRPVKNEQAIRNNLFELDAYKHNHIFQVAMPGDNFLLIDFYKMSYWPDTSVLPLIFNIARTAAVSVTDSFTDAISSKRIDVHVPVSKDHIACPE